MQRRTALRALIAASLALTSIGGLGTAHATGTDAPRVTPPIERIAAPAPTFVSRSYSASCGLISCKLYFDRATTRKARDLSLLTGLAAAACTVFSGPAVTFCVLALKTQAGAISSSAGRFYDRGDCLKLKIFLTGSPVIPERHPRGERNCK